MAIDFKPKTSSKIDFKPVEPPIQKEQTPGFLGKASRFLGVEELGQGIGKALFRLTPEAKMTDEMLSKGKITPQKYEEITTGGITPKQVIGSGIQTAALFAPGVSKTASTLAKTAGGAGLGYVYDVAGKLRGGEEYISKVATPGFGTAIGGTLGLITGLASAKNLKKQAVKLESISERLTPPEKQKLAKQGKDIAEYISKKGIVGTPETRYNKISKIYDNFEDQIQKSVKMDPKRIDTRFLVPKENIIKELQAIPDRYATNITEYPSVVKKVESAIKTLNEKFGNKVSLEDINKIKRNMWDNAYSRANSEVINDVAYEIGDRMKGIMEKTIPALRNFNKEYGMVIAAKRALFKATTRPELGLIGKGVSTAASGIIGGAVGGPMGAAAGTIAGPQIGETLAGTATRTYLGAGLRGVANLIEKIPTDKAGNLQIGKKALLGLIKNSGE